MFEPVDGLPHGHDVGVIVEVVGHPVKGFDGVCLDEATAPVPHRLPASVYGLHDGAERLVALRKSPQDPGPDGVGHAPLADGLVWNDVLHNAL